ncbi:phage tail protein [Wolbachia pipientis]|uniref:phage tail protein n=1 Tax=Wolbachia pipientis TaxID=955 RepID=UPI001BD92116|nr:phage tail protein [Wolbachia pipientis]UIP92016.1 phage tail protein [Wolbachia pipientis]
MKSLLPSNATKQEQALVDAIDYKVDPSCIKGFKFNLKEETLPCLIEEYELGEILRWVKDKRKAVVEGVKFQRLRGTPESLKIALKWANIEDITIIEEPPGKHFFELQIGIKDVPNDFFVDAVVELAKLSLPARLRLMRIFNDHYNVDRFILDESLFGSLLSDYSGRKVEKDGQVLSFGRKNTFELKSLNPNFKFSTFRIHYEQAFSNDIYRLDVAVLGETEPHTKDYQGIYIIHDYKVENYTDQKIIRYGLAEHNVYYKNDLDSEQKDSIHELEKHILVFYPGVLKWHEHRHLHRSWKNSQVICLIS